MLSVKIEIGAEIRRADGTVRKNIPFRQCRCLLKQFIMLMTVHLQQDSEQIIDTGGTLQYALSNSTTLKANATSDTNYGILIGTGTTTVTLTDYKLETQVTTNITHETVSFTIENPDASTWSVAISRSFINNTGGTVNIGEVALYVKASSNYIYCMDRTLYPVTLNAMEAVALTYRISVKL